MDKTEATSVPSVVDWEALLQGDVQFPRFESLISIHPESEGFIVKHIVQKMLLGDEWEETGQVNPETNLRDAIEQLGGRGAPKQWSQSRRRNAEIESTNQAKQACEALNANGHA